MRSIRLRILAVIVVLAVAGVGAWQLLPSGDKKSDPVRVGTTDEVSALDPAGVYDAGSWAIFSNLYQSLLTFKVNSTEPVPDAAESCEFIGQKVQTYQCVVRDNLKFSSGRKITGEDVKYSIDRMRLMSPKVAPSGPQALFSTLGSIKAEGQKVTFNLSSRDAAFPLKLATGAGAIVDREKYPEKELRTDNAVDASGPYVLKEYEEGKRILLEPNKNYKGAVKRVNGPVEVKYYTESQQLADAWKNGQVDVTHRQLPPSVLKGLNVSDTDKRITEADSAEIRMLVFNTNKGQPFGKKAVRQAAAAIIDRQKMVTDVYENTVVPLYSLIPTGFTGHSTPFYDLYPEPNVKEAERLLKKADVETPVKFTLAYRQGADLKRESQLIKDQLEKSGLFEVKLKEVAWKTFTKAYATGEYEAFGLGWLPDFPDPDTFSQPLVGSNNSLHNGYTSTDADHFIANTQRYDDRGRAAADFKALNDLVAKDVPMIPLWQKKDYVLSSKDVKGSQYLSDGTGLWRLWELGWI
ncbi:ABC transporter substrate-binding protein [Streptomyces sp. NPDC050504]|uniref:ABC transporter substrate-binding protein n=1 Tax=Streptomyces sp. NPDC050504 TaxID=3365618 RepID=UPI0037BA7038